MATSPADLRLARWAQKIKRSELQDLLSEASRPEIISFALGLPDPALFPIEEIAQACRQVLSEDSTALQYTPPLRELQEQVVKLMASRGICCSREQVFLTSGAQQGLSLLARVLMNPRDTVIVENHTYTGLLQALLPLEPTILTVVRSRNGELDLDQLELQLERCERPAFLYTIPDGHNPLGNSLSYGCRVRLVSFAQKWQLPIIEDDAYGFLQYEQPAQTPLRAMESDYIFYVGSFAKILAPSLRAGWLIVPEQLIIPLSALKEASDIEITTFSQRVLSRYLRDNSVLNHIELLRSKYSQKKDLMIRCLRSSNSLSATFTEPSSGFFVWLELAKHFDTNALLRHSLTQEKLAFVPGGAFSSSDGTSMSNALRLSFSHPDLNSIEEGISRLERSVNSQQSFVG